MEWYNPAPTVLFDGDHIHVVTAPKSDFWRTTHYGFVRDNGHFYFQPVLGDFLAEVKVSGGYKDRYDQAGLMMRIDEMNWLKCGIEYFDDVQHASVVVTREFSDWSVTPLPHNPSSVWFRLTRDGDTLQVFYSPDGQNYELLRLGYLPPTLSVQVGIMCASPDGEGFPVTFEGFKIRSLQPL